MFIPSELRQRRVESPHVGQRPRLQPHPVTTPTPQPVSSSPLVHQVQHVQYQPMVQRTPEIPPQQMELTGRERGVAKDNGVVRRLEGSDMHLPQQQIVHLLPGEWKGFVCCCMGELFCCNVFGDVCVVFGLFSIVCLSVCLRIRSSVCFCLSCLSVCLSVCPVCLSLCQYILSLSTVGHHLSNTVIRQHGLFDGAWLV